MKIATMVIQNAVRILGVILLVLGFMFYGQSSGLVLYWLTGGLVGIAQQWLLSRGGTPQAVAVSIPPVKKKK